MKTQEKIYNGNIYKFENKLNGKIYIGQSRCIERRYESHVYCDNPKYELDRAIKKYGIDNFNYDILETFNTTNLDEVNKWMDEREDYYIQFYNCLNPNGYNLLSNRHHPEFCELTRERISTSCLGNKNGFYGRKHSEETRKRMSESAKKRGNNNSYEKIRAIDYYKDDEFICTFINYKECKKYFKGICGDKILRKMLNNIPVNKKLDNIKLQYSDKPGHRSCEIKPHTEETIKKQKESYKNWKESLTEEEYNEWNKKRIQKSIETKKKQMEAGIFVGSTTGKKAINNGVIGKKVLPEEVDKYLQGGWKLGALWNKHKIKLDN